MDSSKTHNELLEYRAYLENNIQYINEINKRIERLILKLEKKHLSVRDCFSELENEINLLLKVYSHFTSLGGYNYCLKLKSLIDTYQHVTNSEIQLSALYYIHSKILELQNEQLKQFPLITEKQAAYNELSHTKKITQTDIENYPFKWITFKRNSIWFIVLFDSVMLLQVKDFDDITPLSGNYYNAVYQNTSILVRDPLRIDEQPSSSILCVTYKNNLYGYFYDELGRKLSAKKNVLLTMAQLPLNIDASTLYGRVRLFGDNYIYLKHCDSIN